MRKSLTSLWTQLESSALVILSQYGSTLRVLRGANSIVELLILVIKYYYSLSVIKITRYLVFFLHISSEIFIAFLDMSVIRKATHSGSWYSDSGITKKTFLFFWNYDFMILLLVIKLNVLYFLFSFQLRSSIVNLMDGWMQLILLMVLLEQL